MEKLKLKPWVIAEQARKEFSLENVYDCPICGTGRDLQYISIPSSEAKCTQCNKTYLKP